MGGGIGYGGCVAYKKAQLCYKCYQERKAARKLVREASVDSVAEESPVAKDIKEQVDIDDASTEASETCVVPPPPVPQTPLGVTKGSNFSSKLRAAPSAALRKLSRGPRRTSGSTSS